MSRGERIFAVCVALGSFALFMAWSRISSASGRGRAVADILPPPKEEFDFIVVGGGSSGCVLASALSEDGQSRVLLLESGGWPPWLSSVPLSPPLQMLMPGEHKWPLRTEEQEEAFRGFHGKSTHVPTGRSLGGTSQMNFHIHNLSGMHETDGRFLKSMSRLDPSENPILKAFLESGSEFDSSFFSAVSSLIRGGRRRNVQDIFLGPEVLDRDNLRVVLNHEVTKLELTGDRVSLVRVRDRSGSRRVVPDPAIKCGRGCRVILSSGAVGTPRVLFSSGIGPEEKLRKLRIPLTKAIPEVGKGLFDQLAYPLYVHLNSSLNTEAINLVKMLNPAESVRYLTSKTGVWSTSGIEAMARFPSSESLVILYAVAAPEKSAFTAVSGMQEDTFEALFPGNRDPWKQGFVLLCVCLSPKSRGRVTFEREGEMLEPVVDPKYLTHPEDVECMEKAVQHGLSIADSEAFSSLGAVANASPELPDCSKSKGKDLRSDEGFLECAIRAASTTMYHLAGSMANAVDSESLRLSGLDNVHVSDASVLKDLSLDFPVRAIVRNSLRLAEELKKSRGAA